MPSRLLVASLLAFVLLAPAAAQQRAHAPAAANGFSATRLQRIDAVLQRYVDENRIAGAVALVLRDGHPAYERAFGWSDKEAHRPMTTDTIFRIASQSKALTATVIMQLIEEGRLTLGNRAGQFIPSFEHTTVAVTTNGNTRIVPATRPITIKDLLTHTAGISYGTNASIKSLYEAKGLGPAAGWGWYTADKNEPICDTMERLGTLPFVAQPGAAWVYGYSSDVLGCIAERVTGDTLDHLIATRITGPLHLTDTSFYLPPAKRSRLAAVYAGRPDGTIVRAPDGPMGQGDYVDGPRRSFSGGAGLLSTARDYARFLEMFRNGGTLDGVRILSPRSVALMTTNQVGSIYPTPGEGWSLAFQTTDRFGAYGMTSVGAFGWGGAYGSWYEVDPKAHLTIVFMIQLLPYTYTDIREKFPTLVYQALEEPMTDTR